MKTKTNTQRLRLDARANLDAFNAMRRERMRFCLLFPIACLLVLWAARILGQGGL